MTFHLINNRQLGDFGATNAQGLVWDDVAGLWVPGDIVRELESADASVTITDLGDGVFDLAATGGGGGGSASLVVLDATTTPDADVPGGTPVDAVIFMKSNAPAPTSWDFTGLSSLPTGWSTRGTVATTFASDGMQGVYDSGESHYYPLGGVAAGGTFEAHMLSGPSAAMCGPQIFNSGPAIGAATGWYTGPNGALILTLGSSHSYDSFAFANSGGAAGTYPIWFRVRFDPTFGTGAAFGSYSTDGSTWSVEAQIARAIGGVNEVALGAAIGSASTAKWVSAVWRPYGSIRGGLLGWWDGSAIIPFD